MRFACLLALVLAAGTAAPAAAMQAPAEAPVLILYDDPDFRGRFVMLDGDAPDLARVGAAAMASSIRLNGGRWEVCVEAQHRGSCQVIEADMRDLRGWAFNDRISSVRALHRPPPDPQQGVTLYAGRDYTGDSLTLVRARADLRTEGFNDRARSIKVHSGSWRLCRHTEFLGACVELSRDSNDLRLHNMDDRLSAIGPVSVVDGFGPPEPGAYASGGITGGVRGLGAVFFPEPELGDHPISACLDAAGLRCGQEAADLTCRAAGLSRAAAFSHATPTGGRAWALQDARAVEAEQILVDLLCAA
ncbi:MAG: beta/gamma crystallin-related protein [Oceanicaulis sp.]